MPPAPSTPVRSRHATHPSDLAASATTSATPPPASTGSPLRLVPRGAASLRTPARRPATAPSSPAPALELSGLSVSHELELGTDSEAEDGPKPGYEEEVKPRSRRRSDAAAPESFEMTPSASSKGKAKEREAYGSTPRATRTLLAGSERQELERLRSMLGRQGSMSPGDVTPAMGQQPPSFERSEFETIVRRLKTHTQPGSLKRSAKRERMAALHGEGDDDWEFAGWGSVSYIPLPPPQLDLSTEGATTGDTTTSQLLGQFRATSVAGNAVFGSVFYSLPAIVANGGTFSALSMLVACAVLGLWRGILVELGGAMRLNGGNYAYLLNVGGKSLGLFGAAMTLLDVVATGTVSAGTAAAYIEGEWVGMPFKNLVLGLLILIVFTGLLLFGVKDSTRLTLSICLFHLGTMALLIVLASATLISTGPSVLKLNWTFDMATWIGPAGAARAVWNGLCVGFLGVTGIECMPTFVEEVKPEAYSKAIRNLMLGAVLLNVPLLLLLSLSLPPEALYTEANLLSHLAATSRYAPRFLKILTVVDAVTVLCGGVLCGGVACCSLIERLSGDGILPRWVAWRSRWTKDTAVGGVGVYLALCIVFYASSGFSLVTLSNIFSLSFTSMMLLYALSALLLHLNLPHLPLLAPATHVGLPQILLALGLVIALLVGNTVLSPLPLALTVAYSFGIFGLLWLSEQKTAAILRGLVWLLDRSEGWRLARGGKSSSLTGEDDQETKGRGKVRRAVRKWLVRAVRRSKAKVVCAWIKDDEISHLVQVVLYTLSNEQTSRLVLIHAYESVEEIPSELQANARLLDEAFPALTIDLKFVAGEFSPSIVKAVASTLDVPLSKHLIGCPSPGIGDLGAFGGARVMRTRGGAV